MAEQRGAQEASNDEVGNDYAREELPEEGTFLSPEESGDVLSSLEQADERLLGGDESPLEDDGVFVSPEELDEGVPAQEGGGEDSPAEGRADFDGVKSGEARGVESLQSDLLSRIAGELRSIKSEIGSLKDTYGTMAAQASSVRAEEARPAAYPTDAAPDASTAPAGNLASVPAAPAILAAEPAGRLVPEETLDDLKKLLGYMDRLLESLPEEKIDEFARSEYFDLYRKIFEFFDLV